MADAVNLQKSYSKLNESMTKHFDERGVKRNFTVPYIDGQQTGEHISAVGAAAKQSGGLTKNLITSAHTSDGKGWGHGEGQTVGHSADALRHTIIPKNDEHAKAVIAAAKKHLDNIASLLGDDDPDVKVAQGQLQLVARTDGAGMSLLDFGVMMQQIMYKPNQAVARAHQGTKPGGHSPKLSLPRGGVTPQQPQDQAQPASGGEAPAAPQEAAAPAGTSPAPAPEAPVEAPAPQGQ